MALSWVSVVTTRFGCAPSTRGGPYTRAMPQHPPRGRHRLTRATSPGRLRAIGSTIDVRFADTDAMGHVNNAVYLTYCEIARIRYWTDVTGEPIAPGHEGAESLILAEARITYRAPVFHGECVTVETRATRIGRTSFTLEHRLTACVAGRRPAARRRRATRSWSATTTRRTTGRAVARGVAAIEAFEGRSLRRR